MKYTLIIDENAQEEIVVRAHAPSDLTRRIEELLKGCDNTDCITCYGEDEIRRISFSEIECITVIDRKVTVIDTMGYHYRVRDRLRELEEILPPYFIRINKSALANEKRILRFTAVITGGVDAIFKCGYKEYVSRRCFAEIRRRYEK